MCRALSAALGLPHYPVDRIQWRPGWELIPSDEFNRKHDQLVEQPKWLIDGFGTWESIEKRFGAADTIVFVDLPLWLHYWWATKRQLAAIIRERPDGLEECPMLPVTLRLYRMIWSIHRDMRPKLVSLLERYRSSVRIIHIRSPREMDGFIRSVA